MNKAEKRLQLENKKLTQEIRSMRANNVLKSSANFAKRFALPVIVLGSICAVLAGLISLFFQPLAGAALFTLDIVTFNSLPIIGTGIVSLFSVLARNSAERKIEKIDSKIDKIRKEFIVELKDTETKVSKQEENEVETKNNVKSNNYISTQAWENVVQDEEGFIN